MMHSVQMSTPPFAIKDGINEFCARVWGAQGNSTTETSVRAHEASLN